LFFSPIVKSVWLHKKTDHTCSGMIRIVNSFKVFQFKSTDTEMQCGPLKPALPTPGKSDVFDVLHNFPKNLSWFETAINLSVKKQKSSLFFKKM